MKALKNQILPITIFLAFIMFMQSCVAYKNQSVTLDKALMSNSKVKIETKDSQTYKYESVILENEIYYGIKTVDNKIIKTELNPNEITKVRLEDKKKSKFLAKFIPVVFVGVVVGFLLITLGSNVEIPVFAN